MKIKFFSLSPSCLKKVFIHSSLCVMLLGIHTSDAPVPAPLSLTPREVSAEDIPLVFASSQYNLHEIRKGERGVPRIRVSTLPRKHSRALLSSDSRKAMFLKTMLPMILQVNETISADRQRLREILGRSVSGKQMRLADRAWVNTLAARYKGSSHDLTELLHRVDVVPASLALAQGVVESGWGLDGLAARKNSPFGHRVMVSKKTPKGTVKGYALKTFDSLFAAIEAYIHNINTHGAYKDLRKLRASMRTKGSPINGLNLAIGLTKYSELGQTYVRKVQKIISQNDLTKFDSAYLDFEP